MFFDFGVYEIISPSESKKETNGKTLKKDKKEEENV